MERVNIYFLREFLSHSENAREERKTFVTSLNLDLFATNIFDLFARIDEYVAIIPEHERYNVHYTLCNNSSKERSFTSQDVVAIDIDAIDINRVDEYLLVLNEFESEFVHMKNSAIVYSGGGLHVLIPTKRYKILYFAENRQTYNKLCIDLQDRFDEAGLVCKIDTSIFAKNHLLRLPKTINRKRGRGDREALILRQFFAFGGGIEGGLDDVLLEYKKIIFAKAQKTQKGVSINKDVSSKFDIETILSKDGCKFLHEYESNIQYATEPEWFAMIQVIAHVSDDLCHELSSAHPTYSAISTEEKIGYAKKNSGPISCSAINKLAYPFCKECKHYGKINNPLQIRGKNFYPTKDNGFYILQISKNGSVKKVPDVEGVSRYLIENLKIKTNAKSEQIYVYKENHYIQISDLQLEKEIRELMVPQPNNTVIFEIIKYIKGNTVVGDDFFSPKDMLSFGEKVWDIANNIWIDNNPDYGFTYRLPFEADTSGSMNCPTFIKFLEDVTANNKNPKQTQQLLCEYAAYCISDISPSLFEKMLILIGSGANGKSVFLDVLKYCLGEQQFSSLSIDALDRPEYLYNLIDKKVNICDEVDRNTKISPGLLKNLISGGEVNVKRLYAQPFKHKIQTKFIFSANSIPHIADDSYGIKRRMLIVPFGVRFSEDIADKDLREKLKREVPQIFNLFVSYIKELKKRKRFCESQDASIELSHFSQTNDTLEFYLQNAIIIHDSNDKTKIVSAMEMYKHYKNACTSLFGTRPVNMPTMLKRLKNQMPERYLQKQMANGRLIDLFYGITLLEEEEIFSKGEFYENEIPF